MKRPILVYSLIFLAALLIFSVASTKILFTDAPQNINTAKEFAGLATSKVRNFLSYVYPFFIGQFLKAAPSLATVKLINIIWLVFDALLLYYMTKKKESFFIFALSPLTWYMAPWVNPILPVSFFMLLSYHFLKHYMSTKNKLSFIASGLSLGIVSALWWPSNYLAVFFIFAFFYNRKILETALYLIPFAATASIRFLIDFYYFNFPFFTSVRGFGSNILFFLDKAEIIPGPEPSRFLLIISLLLIISPLIFKLYKLNFRKYRHEVIFLALSTILFFMNLDLRYFITISPMFILLLTPNLTKTEIKLHYIISIFLIIIFTASYFGATDDSLIAKDLKQIEKDSDSEIFIVGTEGVSEEQAMDLSTLYWGSKIKKFVTYTDYKLSLDDENVYREYSLETSNKINELRKMKISITYLRSDDNDYSDIKDLIIIGDALPPEGFELVKAYNILRLYQKV